MSSQTRSKFPTVYDTLNIGIALYDPAEGVILDANERFESLLGYTTVQLRDISVEAYTANTYPFSESEFRDRLQASAEGTPQQFTWRVKRADGELIWVQIQLSGQKSAGRPVVLAEMRDITDYYETHHRAELFWRMLRHNLRNEATILLGSTDRIRTHTESDLVQEAAETIQTRVENLCGMADSVSEIEQAVTRSDSQDVTRRAAAAVLEVVDEIGAEFPAADISLTERAEMWIHVDSAFSYALRHALENAIVHSNEAKPVVDVRIGPSPNTGRVEICIKDTNPHIPDDELKALFTPTETTSTSHGSGVGLFVMKWCIESLGGEIKFETRDPQGNAVYIYLPPKTSPDETVQS